MDWQLDPVEARILASLIEKEITTPEYYPMTLNAVVLACNQKSNREPAVNYDEPTVEGGLEGLRGKKLAYSVSGAGHRVPKHQHRFSEFINLGRREMALLCELMLRGPQTLGELRGRAQRMHDFSGLDEVESCLRRLMEWESGPLVARLDRQAGTKEPRYAHLLSGEVVEGPPSSPPASRSETDRVAALEVEVRTLRQEVAELRQQLADFQKQFE